MLGKDQDPRTKLQWQRPVPGAVYRDLPLPLQQSGNGLRQHQLLLTQPVPKWRDVHEHDQHIHLHLRGWMGRFHLHD